MLKNIHKYDKIYLYMEVNMTKGRLLLLYICFFMGILLFILGIINFIQTKTNNDDKIYTTATISYIDKITNEEDSSIKHIVYVEFEIEDELYEIKLNSYSTKYNLGDIIDIYYYPNDLTIVYSKGSEYIMLGYSSIGLLVVVICSFVYVINKKKASKEA